MSITITSHVYPYQSIILCYGTLPLFMELITNIVLLLIQDDITTCSRSNSTSDYIVLLLIQDDITTCSRSNSTSDYNYNHHINGTELTSAQTLDNNQFTSIGLVIARLSSR